MNPFGTTRSRIARDHALIAPDSHVRSPLAGWERTPGVVLISPRMGADFAQYLAFVSAESSVTSAGPGVERLIYIVEGRAQVELDGESLTLAAGGYAFLPADHQYRVSTPDAGTLLVFERAYAAPALNQTGVLPESRIGQSQDLPEVPFLGDPSARLKTLLPESPGYDMAVNIFTYDPGATLPFVEVHVMEHGLLMLEGAGVYRLADSWYPVQEGDAIWMDAYCPQWFVAMGKRPARYIYYKDVNRDPLRAMR